MSRSYSTRVRPEGLASSQRMHRHGESPEERSARKLIAPTTKKVEQFGMEHINKVPSLDEAQSILAPMKDLVALLESTDEASCLEISENRCREPCGCLRAGCENTDSRLRKTLGKLAEKVLLLAASNRHREANAEDLKQFDKGPDNCYKNRTQQ